MYGILAKRASMKPLGNNLFVQEIKQPKSKFEVINNDNTRYKVIAISEQITQVKKGDFVLCENITPYNYADQKILVVKEEDIVGVSKD